MSVVYYGGVQLQITNFLEYVREPQLDSGNTYLYTAHKMHFRCIYNPAATSYTLIDQTAIAPPGVDTCDIPIKIPFPVPFPDGVLAPDTDVALRHLLEQPRLQLALIIGQELLIYSPPFVAPDGKWPTGTVQCDANMGPVTTVHSIMKMKGIKTFEVDFSIVTWINECYLYNKQTPNPSAPGVIPCPLPVILSHRWRMTHDVDENLFTRRTIQGHAIFRTDAIQLTSVGGAIQPSIPDDFRAYLFHPIPANFKRVSVRVTPNEDSNRLDYVVVDEELPFNLQPDVVAAGVTKIEAVYTDGYTTTDALENIIAGAVGSGLNVAGDLLSQSSIDPVRDLGLGGALALKLGAIVLKTTLDMVPRRDEALMVRVYGHRNTTRANLYNIALRFLDSRPMTLVFGKSSFRITEDLMGKMVQINVTMLSGPIGSVLGLRNLQNPRFFSPKMQSEEIAGVTQSGGGQLFNNPHGTGGRGTYQGLAVSQQTPISCQRDRIPCDPSDADPDDVKDFDCRMQAFLTTQVVQLMTGDLQEIHSLSTE